MRKIILFTSLLLVSGSMFGMLRKAGRLGIVLRRVLPKTRQLVRSLPIMREQKRLFSKGYVPYKKLHDKLDALELELLQKNRTKAIFMACGLSFPAALFCMVVAPYVDNTLLSVSAGFLNSIMGAANINIALKNSDKIHCIERQLDNSKKS